MTVNRDDAFQIRRAFVPRVVGIAAALLLSACQHEEAVSNDLVSWQMRGLVKEIEFYRLVNGSYPATLAELSDHNSEVATGDLFARGVGKGCPYDYFFDVTSGKYELASVGPDGKIGTADDVLPELSVKEKQAVGWRIKLEVADSKSRTPCPK